MLYVLCEGHNIKFILNLIFSRNCEIREAATTTYTLSQKSANLERKVFRGTNKKLVKVRTTKGNQKQL